MAELFTSPIHDRHVALGAKLGEFGGWDMPIEYPSGVIAEHTAVRDAVGIFDVSHLGKAWVRGPGAADYCNSVLTADMGKIAPGKAQYTMCCNERGGVVDDLITYLVDADNVLLVPNAANTATVVGLMSAAAPDGVAVTNNHRDFAVFAVQGRRSAEVLEAVGLPTPGEYMSFTEAAIGDMPIFVCRSGYTGELGFELMPRWEDAGAVWDLLAAAVAERGGMPCGLGARDTLRTEMGYPLHGQDISPTITPVMARSTWAVGFKKPTFWGKDALVAEKEAGPARKLWGIKGDRRSIPRPHMDVLDAEGNVVGTVTSGTFSPTLKIGIGLALIDAAMGPGATVHLDLRGRDAELEVVKPPFVAASTS